MSAANVSVQVVLETVANEIEVAPLTLHLLPLLLPAVVR